LIITEIAGSVHPIAKKKLKQLKVRGKNRFHRSNSPKSVVTIRSNDHINRFKVVSGRGALLRLFQALAAGFSVGVSKPLRSKHLHCRYLRHRPLLALQLLVEGLTSSYSWTGAYQAHSVPTARDARRTTSLSTREWLFNNIPNSLTPTLKLLGEKTSLSAIGTGLGGIYTAGLINFREHIDRVPAFRFLRKCPKDLSLLPQDITPGVEGNHVNAIPLGIPDDKLAYC
jgi:hypothetical protein